jgi:quercetin dioxygenase-like cupin family protein
MFSARLISATALLAAGLWLGAAPTQADDAEPTLAVEILFQQALGNLGERELLVLEVTVAPSGNFDPHFHPGPTFLYVLDGAVELSVDDEPVETYRAGDWFYEPPMSLHATTRNPSDATPARLVAFMIMESGEPATQMEP